MHGLTFVILIVTPSAIKLTDRIYWLWPAFYDYQKAL